MATQQYDDGPEVALQPYPEVIPQQPTQTPSHAHTLSTAHPSPTRSPAKLEDNYVVAAPGAPLYGNAGGVPLGPQYQQYLPHLYNPLSSRDAVAEGSRIGDDRGNRIRREGPCGCPLVVFLLSTVIAILATAVIGLAAGTGVEANRANQAIASLAALSSSIPTTTVTATAATATATSFDSIDNNCSSQPGTVTGTVYTSFQELGQVPFTMHCNKDAEGDPLLSLFVADFDTCMDACSGYSKYVPSTFGETNLNTTCGGVSFIPLWTNKVNATAGGAPGNCYLKPSPQNTSTLATPNIGTECHAAILTNN